MVSFCFLGADLLLCLGFACLTGLDILEVFVVFVVFVVLLVLVFFVVLVDLAVLVFFAALVEVVDLVFLVFPVSLAFFREGPLAVASIEAKSALERLRFGRPLV